MKAKKILFPTDFSHTGDAALEFAATLAKAQGGELHIVHVQESPLAYNGEMYYGIAEPTTDEQERMLQNVTPPDPTVIVKRHLLIGDPADKIVEFAQEEGIDLIVLGSHGRTGIARFVMGSVAEVVVRKAKCSVLVCKKATPPAQS